ncbi:MAG: V4R domain-containing protein [Gemmatimonadaceae bacterium]
MTPFSLGASALSAVPRASLTTLRASLVRDLGNAYATVLQEAGTAGGGAVFAALQAWCGANGLGAPESLDYAAFQQAAARFFADTGWGTVTLEPLGDAAVAFDSPDWAEADPAAAMAYPSCYYTAGMLGDVFGRVASGQIGCLEVECRSAGAARCRFLLASPDVIAHVYRRLTDGVGYADALKEVA